MTTCEADPNSCSRSSNNKHWVLLLAFEVSNDSMRCELFLFCLSRLSFGFVLLCPLLFSAIFITAQILSVHPFHLRHFNTLLQTIERHIVINQDPCKQSCHCRSWGNHATLPGVTRSQVWFCHCDYHDHYYYITIGVIWRSTTNRGLKKSLEITSC